MKDDLTPYRQAARRRWRRPSRALGFRPWRLLVITALLLLSVAATPLVSAQTVEDPDFEDQLVATVDAPTALAFTPDDRILVTEKRGILWVVENDTLVESAALDLSAVICANSERGLLGVAVDPAFGVNNNYIYLYYTFKKSGGCPTNTSGTPVNRVSRFELVDNSVAAASEEILLDNIPSPNGNHNGGDLQFGKDGNLYVSVGDGGCDLRDRSRCQGENRNARLPHFLLGKILRITTTGGIPAGNPYAGRGKRCAMTGRTTRGDQCRETFASGLRNPFRIAFNQNAAGTVFRINDVGGQAWEEINAGKAGADYGWNLREGRCKVGSFRECGKPPRGLTNPIFSYSHRNGLGCGSITGGAFVPDNAWPAAYDGAYLFADFVCDRIFSLKPGARAGLQGKEFASDLGSPTAMALNPSDQGLYYLTFKNGGEVHRIVAMP